MNELTTLRAEMEQLRARLDSLTTAAAPAGTGTAGTTPADTATADADVDTGAGRRVSRRGLLAAAVAGGAGLVATQVTTAAPAAAAPGNPIVMGATNFSFTSPTILAGNPSSEPTLAVTSTGSVPALSGRCANTGWGVDARSEDGAALAAQSQTGPAVDALSVSGPYATYSVAQAGIGVYGQSGGSSPGVYGVSEISGPGVRGISEYGHGVHGHSAQGVAVRAEAGTDETGLSPGPGTDAVHATAVNGYGVHASGGRAPLRLVPAGRSGPPRSGAHQRGELWVDSLGVLFLCTKGGRPGEWKTVTVS